MTELTQCFWFTDGMRALPYVMRALSFGARSLPVSAGRRPLAVNGNETPHACSDAGRPFVTNMPCSHSGLEPACSSAHAADGGDHGTECGSSLTRWRSPTVQFNAQSIAGESENAS